MQCRSYNFGRVQFGKILKHHPPSTINPKLYSISKSISHFTKHNLIQFRVILITLMFLIFLQIIFIPCKRILELCGVDTDKLRLTNNRLVGKPDDEIDSTDGEDELEIESSLKNSSESTCDISASLEDLKGELDPENISSNDECDSSDLSNSESSGCMSFQTESSRRKSDSVLCGERKSNIENKLELLQPKGVQPNDENLNNEISKLNEQLNDNNFNAIEGSSTSSRNIVNKCTSVDDVAAAFSTNIEADGDLVEKVKKLQVWYISLYICMYIFTLYTSVNARGFACRL